jgi:nucleoside transporter
MPTLSLANSISFSQMKDPGKEFPSVRVFGTVGWIVAGIMISYLDLESSVLTFRIAAACSLLLGIFSFFLPDTPAKNEKASIAGILGLDALVLFRQRSFNIFFITSILICIPLAFYYGFTNAFLNDTGLQNAAGKMTLGQVSEVLFMLILPLLYVRLGVKKILLIGMAAWVVRYLFFSFGDTGAGVWMLYGGIILHGVCYDFFFVTGQIYIDNKADPKVRSAAQGLITLATYGLGMLIGSFASGYLAEQYGTYVDGVIKYDWQTIWMYPAGIAAVVIIMFTLLFRDKDSTVQIE